MRHNWNVGDLTKFTIGEKQFIGCIYEIFLNEKLCRISIMNDTLGSDTITVAVNSLEGVDDEITN